MLKALGFALYGPLAASTRYRLQQYIPCLAERDIDLQVRSLLDDSYLKRRFRGQSPSLVNLLRAGLERFRQLSEQHCFDVVILYGELYPLLPALIERQLLAKPYVYDFDDAFQLKYRSGSLRRLEPFLGSKIDRVIQGAAAVSAGILPQRSARQL